MSKKPVVPVMPLHFLPKTRLAIAAIAAVAPLLGCVAPGPAGSSASRMQAVRIDDKAPRVFTVGGGVTLTRSAEFSHPVFPNLPRVQSEKDLKALTELTRRLLNQARQDLIKNNNEGFWANYYAGQKLAAYLVDMMAASDQVIRGMKDSGAGKIASEIPPQTMAILPVSRSVGELPLGLPPERLLDGSAEPAQKSAPLTINNLLGIQPSQISASKHYAKGANGLPSLSELPDNVPVELPNGIVAVRSKDIMVFSNPTNKRLALPLSDMGYVLPTADNAKDPFEWTRIALAISQNKNNYFWDQVNTIYAKAQRPFRCDLKPPAVLQCSDGKDKWYAPNGAWAQSKAEALEAARQYDNPKSAFRKAMDQALRMSVNTDAFNQKCMSGRGPRQASATDDELSGIHADFVAMKCWRATQEGEAAGKQFSLFSSPFSQGPLGPFYLVYSQQYQLLDNGKTVQTEASMLSDAKLRERLYKWQREKELMQSITGLIPIIGQADALARCSHNPDFAPTAYIADYLEHKKNNQVSADLQAADFIDYKTPNAGLVVNIMDCSAVIMPVVSWVKKGSATASATSTASKSFLDDWPKTKALIDSAKQKTIDKLSASIDRLNASNSTALEAAKLLGIDGAKTSYKIGKMFGYLDWYAEEAANSRTTPQSTPYEFALHEFMQQ